MGSGRTIGKLGLERAGCDIQSAIRHKSPRIQGTRSKGSKLGGKK